MLFHLMLTTGTLGKSKGEYTVRDVSGCVIKTVYVSCTEINTYFSKSSSPTRLV